MKVLINHNGSNNAEIIGADINVVNIKSSMILDNIHRRELTTPAQVFIEILKNNGMNDAEKLVVFHTVNKILEENLIIILPPKGN